MNATTNTYQIHQALNWIVSLLNCHQVPYQVVGGLAAQAYGARRPLVDIDIYVPLDQAHAALEEMKPYLVREPLAHHSASWDLIYLALDFQGVPIEIGDSSTNPRFYNHIDQRWEPQVIDYTASENVEIYGIDVAVMPKDELLRYKAMLDREVDHLDIQQIVASASDIQE
jgi:hypothetical protein